ncbi:MAG TPA: hypothetical protein VF278_18765 [Pirellulales bacterium]
MDNNPYRTPQTEGAPLGWGFGPKAALERLYHEYPLDNTPPEQCVEFVFHTYYGLLAFVVQHEHRFRLPPDRGRELLWRFHKFNLSWGLLAYGALVIPLLSYGNYLAQKRRIAKQVQVRRRF